MPKRTINLAGRAVPPPPTRLEPPPPPPPTREELRDRLDRYKPEGERARQELVQAQRARLADPRGSSTRATTVSATCKHADEISERGKRQKRQAEQTTDARRAGTAAAAFPRSKDGQTAAESMCYKPIARLPPDLAAVVEQSKPSRIPPLILHSAHEAVPALHEDWTLVPGAWSDPDLRAKEMKLRQERNELIHEALEAGRPVWYPSSGNSMWPLVQSGDFCTVHPLQAVTADMGRACIPKEESNPDVGDIVFCLVQPQHQYYAHIVIDKQWDRYRKEHKYWIGGIRQNYNGYCFREHIFGILVAVQVQYEGRYFKRPLPKSLYETVQPIYENDSKRARTLCEPDWEHPE